MGLGMYGGPMHGGIHGAIALYAVLAALGYWVLQHAWKETASLIKRTGAVVGLLLVVIGLAGILCGVGSHMKRNYACCENPEMRMRGGPGMKMMHWKDCKCRMCYTPEAEKAPAPETKKTK